MISPRMSILALAAATSIAAVSGAHSIDMPLASPVVPDFSGWYLRGDIGFSNQSVRSLFNADYANFDSVANIDKGFDAAPFFDLGDAHSGVGVRFNLGGYDYQPPPPPLRGKG